MEVVDSKLPPGIKLEDTRPDINAKVNGALRDARDEVNQQKDLSDQEKRWALPKAV